MKKMIIALCLGVIGTAQADLLTLNCDSLIGTDHNVSLVIVNHALKQILVPNFMNNRLKSLVPNILPNQCMEGKTIYTIVGTNEIIEIENRILSGREGILRIEEEAFNCHQ